MSHPILLAERANGDQDRLLKTVMPIVEHTSIILRAHLQSMLERGKRFGIKTFLTESLQKQLAVTMLSAHLAGIRRTFLTVQQAPKDQLTEYMKKDAVKRRAAQLSFDIGTPELELSVFGNVINYLKKKTEIDLAGLQKKYDTLAFKVLSSVSEDINSQLEKTVKELIYSGAHVKEAKKILGSKFDQLGLRPASKGQLETIFRTQTSIAFSAGKFKSEYQNKTIQDALWGYKYVTTGDDRVRPNHAVLDGVTLPKEHSFWKQFYPPNGWNCRCQAIPLFEVYPEVHPQKSIDGVLVKPDKGFVWSAGAVFNPLAG